MREPLEAAELALFDTPDVLAERMRSGGWPYAGRQIRGIALNEASISRVTIAETSFSESSFGRVTFSDVVFAATDWTGCEFFECRFIRCRFAKGELKDLTIEDTDVGDLRLEDVSARNVLFRRSQGLALRMTRCLTVGLELHESTVATLLIDGGSHEGLRLSEVTCQDVSVEGSSLERLTATKLACPSVNFSNAHLGASAFLVLRARQLKLSGGGCHGMSLVNSDVGEVELTGTALFAGVVIRECHIGRLGVAAGSELAQLTLRDCELASVVLRPARASMISMKRVEISGSFAMADADLLDLTFVDSTVETLDFRQVRLFGSVALDGSRCSALSMTSVSEVGNAQVSQVGAMLGSGAWTTQKVPL